MTTDFPTAPSAYGLNGPSAAVTVEKSPHASHTKNLTLPRAQLLSHGLSGAQAAHYDRYEYMTEKRNALEAWERRLEDIAEGKSSDSNVLPMKRRKPLG